MEQKEQREKIYLSSPTMHGEEQKFVAEAFDTNWVAPLGPNVNNFEKEIYRLRICGGIERGYGGHPSGAASDWHTAG